MVEEQYNIPEEPEKKPKDDMTDLFEVNREELTDTEDLVSVDIKKDIIDGDEEGTLDDITQVTEEDVMGDDLYGQSPLSGAGTRRSKARKKLQTRQPYIMPSQLSGLNG